jgi:hypothetical protein
MISRMINVTGKKGTPNPCHPQVAFNAAGKGDDSEFHGEAHGYCGLVIIGTLW